MKGGDCEVALERVRTVKIDNSEVAAQSSHALIGYDDIRSRIIETVKGSN